MKLPWVEVSDDLPPVQGITRQRKPEFGNPVRRLRPETPRTEATLLFHLGDRPPMPAAIQQAGYLHFEPVPRLDLLGGVFALAWPLPRSTGLRPGAVTHGQLSPEEIMPKGYPEGCAAWRSTGSALSLEACHGK